MKYTEQDRLEAASWFLDIHDTEDPSPELLHEWMRWIEESEGHRLAFVAIESAWHEVPSDAAHRVPLTGRQDDEYDGSVSIEEWRAQQHARSVVQLHASSMRPRRRRGWVAFAAAAALAVIAVGATLNWQGLLFQRNEVAEFETRTGEHMQVMLADGSQVNLGARSKLAVVYSATGRDVRLLAGEGFFSVHKDPARPFRVRVLNGVVTAVGTAFDVRMANDRVVVAVAEGTVQVTGPETQAEPKANASSPNARARPRVAGGTRVTRGESLSFLGRVSDQSTEYSVIRHVDPEQSARWRDGWLIYRDEPLRDVLVDVSRYTDRDIVIADGVSVVPHFTGAVFKDSVLEWLDSLPNAFPVTIKTDGAHIIIGPASDAVLVRSR